MPNIGLNAVAGPPARGVRDRPDVSFDEIRDGCFDIEKRILDMNANGVLGSLNFPRCPGSPAASSPPSTTRTAALALAQAYNDWHIDEWCGTHPGGSSRSRSRRSGIPRRCADEIHRVAKKGCHAVTFPENPEPLGLPSLHSDHWDPFWQACSDEGTIVCMHIGSSSKLVMTAADAPIDVMIVLQPMNIVQCRRRPHPLAGVQEVPRRDGRALRGRDRLDPVLPRAPRPQLQRAQGVDGRRLRLEDAERGVHGARRAVLHLRRGRREAWPATSASTASPSRSTTRTRTPRGRARPSGSWSEFAGTDLTDAEINR